MDPTIITAARALGEVAGRSPPYVDADELWTGLVRGDTDAVTMYSFSTQLRTNRRSRMSVEKLLAKRDGRKARAAKDQVWMLYCFIQRTEMPAFHPASRTPPVPHHGSEWGRAGPDHAVLGWKEP